MQNNQPAAPRPRLLICTCCGKYAGKWLQYWNQDDGYGLCESCREWIWERNHPSLPRSEFEQTYGQPGVNYAPWPEGHPASSPQTSPASPGAALATL